ncbi:hypothetical protein [Kibdelosporangium phytohabitans]|uniref:Uncharacterized protein n=1 Tax=Kibdelosporangium phytohabitans TaxID=860235 RepID=A0A0N9I8F4_9PSEU|nr:hypothetical protein [Kibdelosporangium phytohabitans]ALG12529.1 hypothetical protein AOZ06_41755 [Kibdelosporangium phytohabitans]MBE1464132.1 hypothetical protein [Kibdelosporangium phytohabitans]
MSPVAIIAIVVGGLVIVGGLLTWMMIWLRKDYKESVEGVLTRLDAEAPSRGWHYEERADSYNQVFDEVQQYAPLSATVIGFDRQPSAVRAHEVVTGQHRGRPFMAARFHIKDPPDSNGPGSMHDQHAIWVRTPVPRPTLDVRSVPRLQSSIGSALGVGDLAIGHREFDARYQVTAENEQFARDVLSPQLIDFLLTDSRTFQGFWIRGQQLEVVGDIVPDHRDPGPLTGALDLRCDILDRIPQQVWT